MGVTIYRNCLQTEIRFSDLMAADICIGGEFAGECRARKLGPKPRLPTPSPALDFPVPGASNQGFSRPFRKSEGGFGTGRLPSGASSVRADFSSLGEADLPLCPTGRASES